MAVHLYKEATVSDVIRLEGRPDALHLPTKAGVAPASRPTSSSEIASARPEGHLSCPTKARTKAMSAAASSTRSVGAGAFLCQAAKAQA